MNNIKITSFSAMLVLLTSVLISQSLTPQQVYEKTVQSVLKVYAYGEDNRCTWLGSAVVVSESGIVITCYHLFNSSLRIEFEKNGVRIKDVMFIGADPDKDILILKIPGGLFPSCATTNSDSLKVGEPVYTLGNPEFYDFTFSSGIITAVREQTEYNNCKQIQFDASISHGSSGGALLNSNGELIGITSSSYEKGQNLNFAIPVNEFLDAKAINPDDSLQVNAMTSFCLAYSNYQQNHYFRARNYYNAYLSAFPNDVNAILLSGKNDYANGLYDSAISKCSRVIEIDPVNKYAYLLRAQALSFRDTSNSGIEDYCKAIEIDSNYFDALIGRAMWYEYKTKDLEKSISDYSRIIKINPGYNFICLYRAEVLLQKGDTSGAVKDLYSSVDRRFDIASTCSYRGNLFSQLGYTDEAIDDYTGAILLEPNNGAYYFSRAVEYSKKADYQNAINDYMKVLWFDPSNVSAYSNLGYTYFHMDKFEQSAANFQKAIELDKKQFDSYLGLALVSFAKKDIRGSKKYLRCACDIEPKLSKGSKGLTKLEKSGFFWTNDEKDILHEIFVCAGYDTDNTDDKDASLADENSKATSPAKSVKQK